MDIEIYYAHLTIQIGVMCQANVKSKWQRYCVSRSRSFGRLDVTQRLDSLSELSSQQRNMRNIPEFTTGHPQKCRIYPTPTGILSDTGPTKANKFIARGDFHPTPPNKERQSRFLPINKGVI